MICKRCGWETGHDFQHGPVEACLAKSREQAEKQAITASLTKAIFERMVVPEDE